MGRRLADKDKHPRLFIKCPICDAEIEIGQETNTETVVVEEIPATVGSSSDGIHWSCTPGDVACKPKAIN